MTEGCSRPLLYIGERGERDIGFVKVCGRRSESWGFHSGDMPGRRRSTRGGGIRGIVANWGQAKVIIATRRDIVGRRRRRLHRGDRMAEEGNLYRAGSKKSIRGGVDARRVNPNASRLRI